MRGLTPPRHPVTKDRFVGATFRSPVLLRVSARSFPIAVRCSSGRPDDSPGTLRFFVWAFAVILKRTDQVRRPEESPAAHSDAGNLSRLALCASRPPPRLCLEIIPPFEFNSNDFSNAPRTYLVLGTFIHLTLIRHPRYPEPQTWTIRSFPSTRAKVAILPDSKTRSLRPERF